MGTRLNLNQVSGLTGSLSNLETEISQEELRIDSILSGSTASMDTFAEVSLALANVGGADDRVDAILSGSTASMDSFAEVKTKFDSLETKVNSINSGMLSISIDGNGAVIGTSKTITVVAPYSGTITEWAISGWSSDNGTGAVSIVLNIFKNGSEMIVNGNKPTLTNQSSNSATISSWTTTSFTKGDILRITIESVTSAIGAVCNFVTTKS
jgi:hypothetical protein